MTIREIDVLRKKVQATCDLLIKEIGPIQIGSTKIFPYGWRKSAKGRTVWRIVEEVITQNLEAYHQKFKVDSVCPADGEVSVYDMKCNYGGESAYINIKSAVIGGKKQRDDISKAEGLKKFYEEDANRHFFVATFFIKFNANMSIEIDKVSVFPIAWIPEIYVNPSNNGNLQSSCCKDINDAVRRTNRTFITLLHRAISVANLKKKQKNK